jgi:hypothetical protein
MSWRAKGLGLVLFCFMLPRPTAAHADDRDLPPPQPPAAVPAGPGQQPPAARPAPAYPGGPAPVVIQTAEAPLKRNGLHFNPLSIAFGVIGLGYERVFHRRFSLQVQMEYTTTWDGDDVWGLGGQVRPYFFFFRPAPGGMYLSPFVRMAYSEANIGSATGSGVGWAVGATIGWSWVLGPVNLRAGGGLQYIDMEVEAHDGPVSARVGLRTLFPALDLSVGFVF